MVLFSKFLDQLISLVVVVLVIETRVINLIYDIHKLGKTIRVGESDIVIK